VLAARYPLPPRSPRIGRRAGDGAHIPQHSIAERPATRAVVVDLDEDAGEWPPATRARDAGELLQRDATIASEADVHNACRDELAVLVGARGE
jgi:hypothetical protein